MIDLLVLKIKTKPEAMRAVYPGEIPGKCVLSIMERKWVSGVRIFYIRPTRYLKSAFPALDPVGAIRPGNMQCFEAVIVV